MAMAKKSKSSQDLKKLVRCNMEMDLIEAEVKALEEGLISKEVFDHLMSLKSKNVHETLQKRLNILDAQAAARVAVDEGLIEKNILTNIASLNQKVPASLKARYLLMFLQPALQRKLEMFRSHIIFIKSEFTTYRSMWRKLNNQYVVNGLINENVLTSLFPEQENKEMCVRKKEKVLDLLKKERDRLNHLMNSEIAVSPTSPSGSKDRASTLLGPQHLPMLNELLVEYSYKWKNIGVALNFQPQDLQTIEATPLLIPGAPKSYLLRLLQDWLQMTLRHTLPPTVENLRKALNSKTVGLGALGSKLLDISRSTDSFSDIQQSYSSTQVSFVTKEPSFYPKCNEIHIGEGESTLLEVQVTTTGKGDLAFSWQKREKACDIQPILYLHNADITWDSSDISCEVKASSSKSSSIVTVPITVHVSCPLDEFTPSLASMYLSRPEVPEDTWPPTGSKKYINLAIIKQQKVNYGSEYTRFTIRGDIDDVLQDKETIDYVKMYDSLKRERQVMFIEGRPGSGKTTFVHKISRGWASNSSGGIIRILLLVSLRVLNTLHNPNLSDILHLFRDLKVTIEMIEKRNGKGVCFIFDGLDEFLPSDGKYSIVYKIIERSYLHQSTVVVASRPAALAEIRNKADKIIEVLGFTSDQIQEYFAHYPFSDATKPAKLRAYLSLHPNILHMCYLPIHATMVAFLFEVTGQVPKTETKMYELFTQFTLVRSISKNKDGKPNSGNNILQYLNEEEKHYFNQICQLALNKTLLNKQVLHQEEISSYFLAVEKGDISLGLITIDRTADLYGFKNAYTFLHLTFQEYLAAYHISTLSDEEQMKLIEEHGHKNHMLVVWKFFCGLVEIKPLQNKFKTLLHKTQGNTLYHFQCAYESQQKIVCAQLLKTVLYDIHLADEFLSTPDFTAIGYVTNTTILPIKLSLTTCDVDIVAIDALLSEMEDSSKHSLDSLHIKDKALTWELINRLLANFQALKSLSLVNQTQQEYEHLKSSIPQPAPMDFTVLKKIQTLTLKGFREDSEEFQMMIFVLRQCKNLTELIITNNRIGKFGVKFLSQSLPHCRRLERINISKNGLSSDEVLNMLHSMKQLKIKHIKEEEIVRQDGNDVISTDLLLKQLKLFHSLEVLEIVLNSENFDLFIQGCQEWKHLKELRIVLKSSHMQSNMHLQHVRHDIPAAISKVLQLYLHNIEIFSLRYAVYSTEGVKSLTDGLQRYCNLKVLDLSGSIFITDEQFKILFSVDFSRLEELYLTYNRIHDNGIMQLSMNLHQFRSLQKLCLSHNFFTGSGARALATELHHCTKLENLDLQSNSIDDSAAGAIAAGLKECTNFKLLYLTRRYCAQFAKMFEQERTQDRKKIFGCDSIEFV